MDILRKILLSNGTVLIVGDGFVRCQDSERRDVALSAEKQRLLKALADKLGYPVLREELYRAYTQSDYVTDPDRVTKMIYNMPDCIREGIFSERGVGYRLEGEDITASETGGQGDAPDCIAMLSGDYYGFFLDPTGTGSVLGAYLRIEAGDQEPRVSAIFGIRSDGVLRSPELLQVFEGEASARYGNYRSFEKGLSKNDRRCFWCEGTVGFVKTALSFTLNTCKGACWTVLLELDNYIAGGRIKHGGEDGKYRGGLGLTVALSSQYGTFAGKFGMIRSEFRNSGLSLKDQELATMLKLSEQDGRIPLMVTTREDNYWYSWFMSQ